MSKSNLIIGSGGGGKSGGGSTRVAQEAADSLRSQQFARVIDLVSEGEIGGLVDGLKSVYLDGTPIQNANGTFNFDGISFASRTGTQDQTFIQGFSSVDRENPVSVAVTNAAAVVKTVTDSEADFARVTLSVPRLTQQNVTNGDVTGTSVQIAIDVQSNGGGYVAQKLSTGNISLSVSSNIASSLTSDVINASINIAWAGSTQTTYQSIFWLVEYREVGAVTWIPLQSGSIGGSGYYTYVTNTGRWYNYTERVLVPPTGSATVSFTAPSESPYEFRLTKTSGDGTLSISGTSAVGVAFDTISGKTSSRYQRSYRIPLTGTPPYDIRVRRLTADSTSQALQNQTFWDSYTEILDQKLRYPNSALMALSIDSARFNTIPVRGYDIRGIIIEVPSNYNTTTRQYSGVWDGTFVNAWSDNPAWIYRDMIVNDRYGAGKYIDVDAVDKWALYEIAQYCDEFVDNGLGGTEPRFTCSIYLQKPEEAYKVIQTLASVFRGISYYTAGSIVAVQDAPKQAVGLFTPANVIGGQFNYSGSSAKTRATAILVSWNDPGDFDRQAIEYVEDLEGIRTRGIIQKDASAVGAKTRGQAHRYGRAILYSERMETEAVTFNVGLDGVSLAPGDVINTSDPVRAGERLGGRIVSATTTVITLDSDVTLDAVSVYTLLAILPDGSVEERTVTNTDETTSILTVSVAFTTAPQDYAIWVLRSSSLLPETWRVVSIEEVDGFNAQVTALEYREDKYAAIEDGVILENRPTTSIQFRTQEPVTNIIINEELYLVNQSTVGTLVSVSWSGNASYYDIEYKRENENYIRLTANASTSVDIQTVTAGNYTFRITAVNALGVRSSPSVISTTIFGLTAPPVDVSNFAIQAINGNAHFSFDAATDLDVRVGGYLRIRHSPLLAGATWSSAVNIGQQVSGTTTNVVLPLISGTYLAKWVDGSGNQSDNAVLISTNAPSIINSNFVETIAEQTAFSGVRDGVALSEFAGSPALVLDSELTVDEMLELVDDWPRLSRLGGQAVLGSYTFFNSVDLGEVKTSVVTPKILAQSFQSINFVDEWTLIDALQSIDGDEASDSNVRLQARSSDDNITFTDWSDFSVGAITARAYEFRIIFETTTQDQNVALLEAEITIDMPDQIQSGDDLTATVAGLRVDYADPFYVNPALGISAQGLSTGDYYELTNKSKTGFDIIFKNSGGAAVERTFDYMARAY